MYYPKAKISTNQYTGGGLLKDTVTGETYRGYYFVTFDGRYFSGASQSIDSDELVLIQSSSINTGASQNLVTGPNVANFQYNTITKDKMSFLNQQIPITIYPSPTSDDYDTGQFTRYFMQRIGGNASNIKEISSDGFKLLANNPLYNTISLVWKLTGPERDTLLSTYTVYGIADTNFRTTVSMEKSMKGISQYLGNLLELARITKIKAGSLPKATILTPIYYQDQPLPNPIVIIDNESLLVDFDGAFLIDFDNSNLETI